ncbi:MAG: glycosyltransferase [Candidatus Berkelbacteria bacterium]|nr:glycosyltransferase [Candidatus Berkelbacteria bacterium]
MRVAIIHDYLTKLGGAEEVLKVLHKLYPTAPIFTLLYDKTGTKNQFENGYDIRPSNLQKLPRAIRNRQKLLLSRFPKAIEKFDLSGFDVVISSSNSFAHGVITNPKTLHITYCYSPTRYLWDWAPQYLKENNIGFGAAGIFIRNLLSKVRLWDFNASKRTDEFIAISKTVAARIKKYYRRDSTVIYPPAATRKYLDNDRKVEDFYLIVSRLSPYKNIDLAIRACNQLKKSLYIVGEGADKKRLENLAGPTIKFLGWQTDETKIELFKHARAFIFPGEDDFGLTPVESMAAGRPVIALNSGGSTETVVAGKTGEFFDDAKNPKDLIDAINRLEKNYSNYSIENCQSQAGKFSTEIFIKNFSEFVNEKYKTFKKK